MSRHVVITGLGAVTGLGIGIDPLWEGVCEGQSAIDRIEVFDPSGFDSHIAAEVRDFKANKFVPKSYRKATKVMAKDIGLAVAAADQAVRDADIITPGIDADAERTYPGNRTGAHIGAGLISADLDELTEALATSTNEDGSFDIHQWGEEGMTHLTPLWLLKYLPNMLACHVTIIHDAQGPSNTITCGETSGGLSVGESLRVIQRGNADTCYCGGAESKLTPMTFFRQQLTGMLCTNSNENPTGGLKPFDEHASGTVIGEGGGIVILEAEETAKARGAKVYATVAGIGAGHTVYPQGEGLVPDPEGKGIVRAMKAALRDAETTPDAIDCIIPYASGIPQYDKAETAALQTVFGEHLGAIPIWASKPYIGLCGAGSSALDIALGAKMIKEGVIPARINCENPIGGLNAKSAQKTEVDLKQLMVVSTGLGGQTVAVVLRKYD